MGIAENIDAVLVKFDINQDALARIADVSPGAVTGWRKGATPRKRALQNMCDTLGLQPDDILSDHYGLAAKEHGTAPALPDGALLPVEAPRRAYAPLLGRVHAGDAQEPEVLDDRVPLPYEVLQNHKRAYFLEVEGDCMSRVYPEGCRVLIDPDRPPQSGSIAVVSIDGADYIMRRLLVGAQTLVLSPESYSDEWEDIVIKSDEHTVEMVGTVVWYQPTKEME